MRTHKDLEVWKNSINIVKEVYEITKEFPKEELFCLSNQIRRAAISIPSNIAEGAARNYSKEYMQFLYISLGSLSELETQLIISFELSYLPKDSLDSIINRLNLIRSQLFGLIKHLKNN